MCVFNTFDNPSEVKKQVGVAKNIYKPLAMQTFSHLRF